MVSKQNGRGDLDGAQAETIRKEEVVDVYAALLDKIWQRALTLLGLVTVRAIFERAIHLTAQKHVLLKSLSAGEQGLNTEEVRGRVDEREKDVIRKAFEDLILNLFSLLAELTGEAIVNKLFAEEVRTMKPET